jgi:hypothetical protein
MEVFMIKIEFISLTKRKAVKKALDYWYKNLYGKMSSQDFVNNCTWKKENNEYTVIYREKKLK